MSIAGGLEAPSARPVLLVHGTNDTAAMMRPLARALEGAGRPVVSLDYGRHRGSVRGRFGGGGIGPLRESARDILAEVDRLLSVTGGETGIDVIGHSQGGLHALACARARPAQVAHVVLLGAPLHGIRLFGQASRVVHAPGMRHTLDTLFGPSAREQIVGSPELRGLLGGAEQADGSRHLFVASRDDWVLRNVDRDLLASRSGWRTVWTHDICPDRRVRHESLPNDPDVIALILDELTR